MPKRDEPGHFYPDSDIRYLVEAVKVVLDAGGARVFCRGIGTTPARLGKVVDRCEAKLRSPVLEDAPVP